MIILAIDSGVEKTGYAVIDRDDIKKRKFTYLTSGLILTPRNQPTEKRLVWIQGELEKIIQLHRPGAIVVERLFFTKNQKTAIAVSQAQGAVMAMAARTGLSITYLTPPQIKQIITGYGNSDKKSVQKMLGFILGRTIRVRDDDESDAIACAIAYCYLN